METSDLTADEGFRIDAPETRLELGRGVTGLGDITGDGYDDFMIGAPELEISGVTRDGDEVPILAGGRWQI